MIVMKHDGKNFFAFFLPFIIYFFIYYSLFVLLNNETLETRRGRLCGPDILGFECHAK